MTKTAKAALALFLFTGVWLGRPPGVFSAEEDPESYDDPKPARVIVGPSSSPSSWPAAVEEPADENETGKAQEAEDEALSAAESKYGGSAPSRSSQPQVQPQEPQTPSYDPNQSQQISVKQEKDTTLPGGRIKMSGHYRLAAGVGDDFIVNDANADMQERNFRYLFGERLENTFDRGIYSQYLLNLDLAPADKINFHTQLVMDPWSWVGTTGDQFQRSDIGTEFIRYNLKYFGAFNSVINEIWRTNVGDSYAFPVIKVHDGHTTREVVHGFFDFNPATGGVPITIPERDIDYELRPIRKFWMDYEEDQWHARVFALADESQALTTDDPLELSNHKAYWQQSPWLYQYKPIQFFTDGSIQRGYYSDNLSFLARDSEGNRLVLLRGAAFEGDWGSTYFAGTVAAPFTPWDEHFFDADNVPGAFRLKHQMNDRWMLGSTYTFRSGLIDNSIADFNYVAAVDTKYSFDPDTSVVAELAGSHREQELKADERLGYQSGGFAYKLGYQTARDQKWNDGHTDLAFTFTWMDREFNPNLSRYSNTRDDVFWGKHLTFTEYTPDAEHFRIGDGVDTNRYVFRAQWKQKLFKERFMNLFDARNVHKASNNAYKETVIRDEATFHATANTTFKTMFRWHGLPETTGGIDPFLSNFYFPTDFFDLANGTLQNLSVPADKDASRFTYAAAVQHIFNEQLTAEGFLEESNDIPDFPRGLLNDVFRNSNDRLEGLLFEHLTNFLYNQVPFGVPPYRYFTILRERVIYKPEDRLTWTLHATQNSYQFTAGIDDNINHVGLSAKFDYSKDLSFFADYTYSQLYDVPRLIASHSAEQVYDGHHNVYLSLDYKLKPSTILHAEYGVFGLGENAPLVSPFSNVTGFSYPTIDTEHLFRVSLTGDF